MSFAVFLPKKLQRQVFISLKLGIGRNPNPAAAAGVEISDPSDCRCSRILSGALALFFAPLFQHRPPAQLDLIAFERKNLDQNLIGFLQLRTSVIRVSAISLMRSSASDVSTSRRGTLHGPAAQHLC